MVNARDIAVMLPRLRDFDGERDGHAREMRVRIRSMNPRRQDKNIFHPMVNAATSSLSALFERDAAAAIITQPHAK